MRPLHESIAACAVLLLGALAHGKDIESSEIDVFLRSWVDNRAEYRIGSKFHESFPQSPHKGDSERFEAAWRCFQARQLLDEDAKAVLVRDLQLRLDAKGTGEAIRGRIVFVLARLQIRAAVPLIAKAALEEEPDLRDEAIEALGLFGTRPPLDGYLVFGGRMRWIALPSCPDPRATKALLAVLSQPGPRASIFVSRWKSRRRAAARALESHACPGVEKVALQLDPSWHPALDLLAALDSPASVRRLVEIARDGSGSTQVRAVEALGETSRRDAVRALLDLLDDASSAVRREADASLSQIADGKRPFEVDVPDGKGRRRTWLTRFGPELERFDGEAIRRRRIREPGLYGVR